MDAAASIGIHVTRAKLVVTLVSAVMTAIGGVLYAQYQLYINPETVSGIGVSLQMVFGVVAGGLYVMLGPTVGAVFTLMLLVVATGLRGLAERRWSAAKPGMAAFLGVGLVEDGITMARDLAHGLSPVDMEAEGFVAALSALAALLGLVTGRRA